MDHAHRGTEFTLPIIFMAMSEKVEGIHFALIETERTALFLAVNIKWQKHRE